MATALTLDPGVQYLYWTIGAEPCALEGECPEPAPLVFRVALAGGDVAELATLASASAIAVDAQYAFFVGSEVAGGPSHVMRVPKEGGPREVIVSAEPRQFVLDGAHIYIHTGSELWRYDKNGDDPVQLVTGLEHALQMLVDGDHLYWWDSARGGLVRVPKLTGGTPELVVATTVPVHAVRNGVAYGGGAVPGASYQFAINELGGDTQVLDDLGVAQAYAVAVGSRAFYYHHWGQGIRRMPFEGPPSQSVLATTVQTPIVIDDATLYWSTWDGSLYRVECR